MYRITIKSYWHSLFTESLERIGDAPLHKLISSIDLGSHLVAELPTRYRPHNSSSGVDDDKAKKSRRVDVWRLLGNARRMWNDDSLMNVWVSIDDKNSSLHVLQVNLTLRATLYNVILNTTNELINTLTMR